MKKIALIIILFIIRSSAYSQTEPDKTKKSLTFVGFQLGLTSTDMNGEQIELETDSPGAKYVKGIGLKVALQVKHEFNRLLYLKSGLGYYQKDGQVQGSRTINATHGPFNFLQIPVLLGIQPINMGNLGSLNLGLESGFSLNYLISSDDNLTKGLHPDNEVDRKSRVPSFHLGLNLEVPINEKILFNASYQYSKDLTRYFNRRYTWYSRQLERETFKDYDLWFKSNSIAIGLIIKVNKGSTTNAKTPQATEY